MASSQFQFKGRLETKQQLLNISDEYKNRDPALAFREIVRGVENYEAKKADKDANAPQFDVDTH